MEWYSDANLQIIENKKVQRMFSGLPFIQMGFNEQ